MNEELKALSPIACLPLIRDAFEAQNYKNGIQLYLLKFNGVGMTEDKIDALNIFIEFKSSLFRQDIDILSSLATVFVGEAPYKEEYDRVCELIKAALTLGC